MKKRHSTSASSYNLRGGIFLGNSMNRNMPWNILVNKLSECHLTAEVLVVIVCFFVFFFASVVHGRYGKHELHFYI